MKMKKSMSLILAIMMLLALASGAWAVLNVTQEVENGAVLDVNEDVVVTGDSVYGLSAKSRGKITMTGNVSTDGTSAIGVYLHTSADIQGSGNIATIGESAHGAFAAYDNTMTWRGNISTNGLTAHGIYAWPSSSYDITGNIDIYGASSYGVHVRNESYAKISGDITTYSDDSRGAHIIVDSKLDLIGDILVKGDNSFGISTNSRSVIYMEGNITVDGDGGRGISALSDSEIYLKDGALLALEGSIGIFVAGGGSVNLEDVTAKAAMLIETNNNGSVTAVDSVLEGDILHSGTTGGTLAVDVVDSTWSGAAEASGDIGVIDVTLENSDWNITGDSNTNGKVTADEDSNIDFRGTDENIVVEIDSLAGAPGLNIKLGDELIIKNQTGNTPSTTTPDIISIVENSDGSISIIPNGDGTGNLTYQYVDENGSIQTVTIGVVSGTGVKPAGGGGGSSGCNAGFGVLALLGLAFVYKKK